MKHSSNTLYTSLHLVLKGVLLVFGLLFNATYVFTQEHNNLQLSITTGVTLTSSDATGLGFSLAVEPEVKILPNTYLGLKIGVTLNSNNYENYDLFQYRLDEEHDNGIIGIIPSLNYYFNDFIWNENSVTPYLGIGLGYYLLYGVEVFRLNIPPPDNKIEIALKNRLGLLLKGGFNINRYKLGLEYHYIPKADINLPIGTLIGSIDNSYLGLVAGITIGGYKSKKRPQAPIKE